MALFSLIKGTQKELRSFIVYARESIQREFKFVVVFVSPGQILSAGRDGEER